MFPMMISVARIPLPTASSIEGYKFVTGAQRALTRSGLNATDYLPLRPSYALYNTVGKHELSLNLTFRLEDCDYCIVIKQSYQTIL